MNWSVKHNYLIYSYNWNIGTLTYPNHLDEIFLVLYHDSEIELDLLLHVNMLSDTVYIFKIQKMSPAFVNCSN